MNEQTASAGLGQNEPAFGDHLVHLASSQPAAADEPPPPQTPVSGIFWSEQSEDSLLRNLFSNASLGYEFPKETDFDCLGLDNLQLNYPAAASQQQQQQQSPPASFYVTANVDDQLASLIANDLTNLNMNLAESSQGLGLVQAPVVVNFSSHHHHLTSSAVTATSSPNVNGSLDLLDLAKSVDSAAPTLQLISLNDPSLAPPPPPSLIEPVITLVPAEERPAPDAEGAAALTFSVKKADDSDFVFKKPLDSAIPSLRPAKTSKKLQKNAKGKVKGAKASKGGKASGAKEDEPEDTGGDEEDEEQDQETEAENCKNSEEVEHEDEEQVDSDDEAEEESEEDEDGEDEDQDEDEDDDGYEDQRLEDLLASIFYHERRSSFEKYRRIESALDSFDLISHLKSAQSKREKDNKSLLKLRQYHNYKQLIKDKPRQQQQHKSQLNLSQFDFSKAKTSSDALSATANLTSSGFFSTTSNSSLSTSPINKLFTFKRSKKRSKAFLTSLINGPKVKAKAPAKAKNPVLSEDDSKKTAPELTTIVELGNKSESPIKFNGFTPPAPIGQGAAGRPVLDLGRKMTKKEKLKQIKLINSLNEFHQNHQSHLHTNNFEPKTKKIAIDTNLTAAGVAMATDAKKSEQTALNFLKAPSSSVASASTLTRKDSGKKEDDDLHINELSLLDLHSSEDDTNHHSRPTTDFLLINRNLKNKLGNITGLKKNMRALSRESLPAADAQVTPSSDQATQAATERPNSVRKQGHLTEIISKRVKYSPASSSSASQLEPSSLEKHSSSHELGEDYVFVSSQSSTSHESSTPANSDASSSTTCQKVDMLIRGLNNSSLDSNQTQSAPTRSDQEQQAQTENQTEGTKKQNKRKKKDSPATPLWLNKLSNGPGPSVNRFRSNSLKKKPVSQDNEASGQSAAIDNDTLQHMKNLDLNTDKSTSSNQPPPPLPPPQKGTLASRRQQFKPKQTVKEESVVNVNNLTMNLNDESCRKHLWNLLKAHSSVDEMSEQFGSLLHDKVTFWDLVEMKLKNSQKSKLKTAYDIIDDYTVLYTNMSELLESFIDEEKMTNRNKKNDNSSRSRSSSRNYRKLSAPLSRP